MAAACSLHQETMRTGGTHLMTVQSSERGFQAAPVLFWVIGSLTCCSCSQVVLVTTLQWLSVLAGHGCTVLSWQARFKL